MYSGISPDKILRVILFNCRGIIRVYQTLLFNVSLEYSDSGAFALFILS